MCHCLINCSNITFKPSDLEFYPGFDWLHSLQCFRLAGGGGGDDIAVRVLFTGGTTGLPPPPTLRRKWVVGGGRGQGGRHHITHHRLSLCKAADRASSLGLRGFPTTLGREEIRGKMRERFCREIVDFCLLRLALSIFPEGPKPGWEPPWSRPSGGY